MISVSYYIVDVFDVDSNVLPTDGRTAIIDSQTANRILLAVVYPMLSFLRYLAAFFFLFAAIFSFYRMVASSGDETGVGA